MAGLSDQSVKPGGGEEMAGDRGSIFWSVRVLGGYGNGSMDL